MSVTSGTKTESGVGETIRVVINALLIALVIRILLFQPFTIPSASMEPTLLKGDYIIVSKFAYGYSRHSAPFSPPVMDGRVMERSPQRGDIAVFMLPRDGRTDYIKRVIGLPGDRVQVREGALYVNGAAVKRQSLGQGRIESPFGFERPVERFRETMPGSGKSFVTNDLGPDGEVDDTGVYIVPQGHFFMMGDNRDNSVDSRYPPEFGVGYVPAENLVGKAEIILFSWHPEAELFKPWTWFTEVRPSRFFTPLK